jgi:hypothetical protein
VSVQYSMPIPKACQWQDLDIIFVRSAPRWFSFLL